MCGFSVVADPTTTLQVKNTGSLSVNRYGWINIWMAILGQFFTRFPLFFESCLILLKTWLEIFLTMPAFCVFIFCNFLPLWGIKRGARLK
ncbi:DUF2684 domain-containing protein [Escherichia coli]|nr:DUF2684 domain-containing protein [Escherichia coli]